MTVPGVGGRPLKFESAEELQRKIDSYFLWCDIKEKPYTVSGLAVFLDTSRMVLIDYEKNKGDAFSDTIKRAKAKIEAFAEEALFSARNVAGVIFNLKNNHNWKDKSEVARTDTITMSFDQDDKKLLSE